MVYARNWAWIARYRTRAVDGTGQALVEYALILSLIAVVAIAALSFLGDSIKSQLNHVAQTIVNG